MLEPRHLRVLLVSLPAALALTSPAVAASPRPTPTPAPSVEVSRAPAPIHVDGKLDDEAWALLEPFTDFVQRDPDEGMPATEKTELLLAYDDEALYVGARMHDSEPDAIEARLSRRDDHSESDRFAIYLDPRGDRRTGVRFEVTAAGVQRDEIIFNDTWTDRSWDALWDAEVTVDRRRVVGGDADPLLRAALPPRGLVRLGRQRAPDHPEKERDATGWPWCPGARPASPPAWRPSRESRAWSPALPSW